MNSIYDDIKALSATLFWYTKRKLHYLGIRFEKLKNRTVDVLMHKRGALQKHVWHSSMVILVLVGILTSGVFGGRTIVSSTYPGIGGPDPRFVDAFEPFPNGPILYGLQDTHTDISQKPRSEIIEYKVENGDTLSTIAKKFDISGDTIKWANNLDDVNQIKPGQKLKILPITGVSHVVKSGDNVESVAKKYQADAQSVVDFPFNDIPDDFKLLEGQILIIRDGQPPETKIPVKRKAQPQYLAQGPASPVFSAGGGAQFVWPTNGLITQNFAWYHPGVDIANRVAPGVAAGDGGVVAAAGWDGTGYGNKVVVNHGNGYVSLYAHLSNIYVTIGQTITRGQVLGQMGSTGRSTGTHLHLEIHYKGVPINPLSILK